MPLSNSSPPGVPRGSSLMARLPLDYDVHWEAALHLHMAGYLSEVQASSHRIIAHHSMPPCRLQTVCFCVAA